MLAARPWQLLVLLTPLQANRQLVGRPDADKKEIDYCEKAKEVLELNWQPSRENTIPAYGLYPHQWSWDSAFIAIGYAGYDPERARLELSTLFKAQWSSGFLPHIVFNPEVPLGAYFPDSQWWRSSSAAANVAPKHIETSGIIQPPVHAIAALKAFNAQPDEAGRAWLAELFPSLVRWHTFLRAERSVSSLGGLVWIRHPWESGMDNAPMWDDAIAALTQVQDCPADTSAPREWSPTCQVPAFNRRDLAHADPSMRPSNMTYNIFVYLMLEAREKHYDDSTPAGFPFQVVNVLFNSILVQATRDLAKIAGILDMQSAAHLLHAYANELQGALEHLWDSHSQMYMDFDVVKGKLIPVLHVSDLMPLALGPHALSPNRRERLIHTMLSPNFSLPEEEGGMAVATTPSTANDFDRSNYWRGPVWINTDWLLLQGMPPQSTAAQRIERSIQAAVVRNGGFYEYFDPFTGDHKGGANFSWSAALYHDVFCTAPMAVTS